MSWLATAGLIFGKTLAKSLVKYWLGDNFINDLLGEGIDKGVEQIPTWTEKPNIETTIARMAQNLIPLFEREGAALEESSKISVVLSIATAFSNTDSSLLVGLNLDANELKKYILNTYPNQTRDFSYAEKGFYNTMLDQVCQAVVKLAPKLDAFDYSWTSEFLKDQDKLISLVDQLMRTPDEADVRFESIYRQAVNSELDKVDFLGVGKVDDITHRQSLSISYVSLQVAAKSNLVNEFSNKQSAKILGKRKKNILSSDNFSGDVEQILTNGSRFIMSGEAGAGKTTLIHWLAVRAANMDFPSTLASWNGLLPFVIHLRDYSKTDEAFPKPEDFPKEVAEMALGEMPIGWAHRQLNAQRSLILIDGVDELPLDKRIKMLEKIKQLVNLYPFNYYIITSRPTALKSQGWAEWERWVEDEGFTELAFQQMDIDKIELFISQWHRALYLAHIEKETDAASLSDGLKRIINRRPDLMKLAETPLLCAMLCALHHDRRDSLPSDRRQLYRECIEILAERRDVKRDITLSIPLNIESKIKLLRYLAYWMMDNQYTRIETRICDEKFTQKARSLPKAKGVTGGDIRAFFVERSNLLREPAVGQIEFVHRSFQEYLAAQYAVLDERNFGALIKNSQDDQWRDVIILSIGETSNRKDRDYILSRLLKLSDEVSDYSTRNKLRLIAAIGMEQSIEAPAKKVKNSVLSALKDVIPPQSSEEIELLSATGNWALPFLSYNRSMELGDILSCIETLSKIGSSEALDILKGYINDERLEIKRELCNSWGMFNRYEYASEILAGQKIFIGSNPISSSAGFELLTNLEDVRIWFDDKEVDIKFFYKRENFKKFSICSKLSFDLSELLKVSNNLEELNIGLWTSSAQIIIVDDMPINHLSRIAEFKKLQKLTLWSSGIQDIKPLASLVNLRSLLIGGFSVNDLDALTNLEDLTELYINYIELFDQVGDDYRLLGGEVSIPKLPSFSNFKNITKLFIGNLQAQGFEDVFDLKSLKSLGLDSLEISDISNLTKLENLEELFIRSLPIQDISWAQHLKSLRKLVISGLKVKSLDPISNLTNLEELIIIDSAVRDLEPISHLKGLRKLRIEHVLAKPLIMKYMPNKSIYKHVSPDLAEIFEYVDEMGLSKSDEGDIKAELQEIETVMRKGKQSDINFIVRRFRTLKRMNSKVADLTLKFLQHPAFSESPNIQKIAEKLFEVTNL